MPTASPSPYSGPLPQAPLAPHEARRGAYVRERPSGTVVYRIESVEDFGTRLRLVGFSGCAYKTRDFALFCSAGFVLLDAALHDAGEYGAQLQRNELLVLAQEMDKPVGFADYPSCKGDVPCTRPLKKNA